jgi:dethiobiotin synthetase
MHHQSYFITGTDTGVGKTFVSCALLRHLAQKYLKVVGMKPVAAGTLTTSLGPQDNEDCIALRQASTVQVPYELDNPYCFTQPISPHLAATAQGQTIDINLIKQRYQALSQQADCVVVEGAGGFMVPLTETHTGADLAQALKLPLVLVVGMRLGCLNHALLTAQAIHASGLHLAGWVANHIDPDMSAQNDNVNTLRQRLKAPLWAQIAHGAKQVEWSITTTS